MSARIEIKNLTKRYGDVIALDNVNFTIEPGEFLILLGPSGCGKTTLLRSLSGLETPDHGEIIIDGTHVFSSEHGISVPPGKRDIGMVFQSYALWPHMKVKDNIGFGLRVKKVPRQEAYSRVDDVLTQLSMSGYGERYPSELSGGQQQRIALARLLATKPSVFLMDEPLSNLDARLRVDMRAELKRFHRDSQATTVFVTHDQMEAMTMASLIAVMEKGKIVQAAAPRALYREPGNLFVADFIGMPRINLLDAELVTGATGPAARISDFELPLAWPPNCEKLVVAARPEDIKLSTDACENSVEFKVHTILPSGPESIVQLTRGNLVLIVRETSEIEFAMDQTVWAFFDTSALNFYDRESGKLLVPPTEKAETRTDVEASEGVA